MRDAASSAWRETATALFGPPADGKIYGTLEVDVSDALRFLREQRASGLHLTLTHLVTAALGRTFGSEVPELNCWVRRGRVVRREGVDVMVAARLARGVAGILVRDADSRSLAEIAECVREESAAHRAGRESRTNRSRNLFARIPWPLRRPAVRILSFAVHDLGLDLPALGLRRDAFGSVLLTNIGTFGLATGMLALFPVARLPAAVAMGRVEERPVVRDGEIAIRPILPLTGTFDHRIVDGEQAGKLARSMKRLLEEPGLLAARAVPDASAS